MPEETKGRFGYFQWSGKFNDEKPYYLYTDAPKDLPIANFSTLPGAAEPVHDLKQSPETFNRMPMWNLPGTYPKKETLETLKNTPALLKGILADKNPCWYERPTQLVFQLSFGRLREPALQAINVMAMFSPDDIPETLIIAKPGQNGARNEPASVREKCTSEPMLKEPRSVQRFVVEELSDNERQSAFDEGVKLLCSRTFRMYRDHLIQTVAFAEMICSAAAYLYETGLAESCLNVARTGEAICEQLDRLYIEDVASPSALPNPSITKIRFDNSYKPPTYSLGTLAGNISTYGASVIRSPGGLINRQEGHETMWKVLKLREEYIGTSTQDQHRLDYENLLSNGYNDWALKLINEARYSEVKGFSEKSLGMKHRLLGKNKD
ncbi:putative 7 alpha-cephem-methoxylase [Fusarium austroafricanum]|uniref:Putative 7 alpha-cephem-methoxylase n=1 Tax=Fusarium austroafricanum TaxID=2364996 RepID=A0A8H4K3N5_9HYPO|nr:putative 7 alpha-cephem-methoxylase [Fusarium austroafricanum]